MSQFVVDTFTDADNTLLENHTGEIGATWTKHSATGTGSAQITTGNRLQNGTSNAVIYTASGTSTTAQYFVQATIRSLSDLNDVAGVVGRLASTTVANGYIAYHYQGVAGNYWSLSRLDSGVETQLGTYNQTISQNTDYELILDLQDSLKSLLVNGISRVTTTDNTYTAAGLSGIIMNLAAGSDTTGIQIDKMNASTGWSMLLGTKRNRIVG